MYITCAFDTLLSYNTIYICKYMQTSYIQGYQLIAETSLRKIITDIAIWAHAAGGSQGRVDLTTVMLWDLPA